MPIFWTPQHEERVAQTAYQSGFDAGRKEGRRQSELATTELLKYFAGKLDDIFFSNIPASLRFSSRLFQENLDAERIIRALLKQAEELQQTFEQYRCTYNEQKTKSLNQQITALRQDLQSANSELTKARQSLSSLQPLQDYSRSLERKTQSLEDLISALQNELDWAKKTGK